LPKHTQPVRNHLTPPPRYVFQSDNPTRWRPELYKRHFEVISNVVNLIGFASRHLAGLYSAVEPR
jgi:hypothetical protein